MTARSRRFVWKLLAAAGILVILAEVMLHFIAWTTGVAYELNEGVIIVGALLGFAGFWKLDPEATKGGVAVVGQFVPRFGRRKSDAIAVPGVKTEVIAEPPPTPKDGAVG